VLARWAGWGALPHVFDESDDRNSIARASIRSLLDDEAWAAARRTTLNAHYTSHEIVQAVWRTVEELGFGGGDVLEPGCGSGNFIGVAPDSARVTGIELDPTTAEIALHLYGDSAALHRQAFEQFDAAEGSFDLVIGNVPFADVVPHDLRHNPQRHRLHNYFIVKSLRLTRPGGLVAVITSRYTLDSRNASARREMASLGDLVGAIRLPAGAFADSAGTNVVADIVIIRRRAPAASVHADGWAWLDTVPLEHNDGDPVLCNQLFVEHPELVAGRIVVGRGMYRAHDLTVEPVPDLDRALHSASGVIVEHARAGGLAYEERSTSSTAVADTPVAAAGSFVIDGTGFARVHGDVRIPYAPRVRGDASELRRLIMLRYAARDVLEAQANGAPDSVLLDAQRVLTDRYNDYRRHHGALNRFTLARTGRTDPESGDDATRRVRPRMGGFRDDPDWPLVAALEVFDDDTQEARPAAIFTERVINPPVRRSGVETAEEAVAVCLDERGAVTLERAAERLGVAPDTARGLLDEVVFEDPDTGALVPTPRYLSGNIRSKLAAATNAARASPRFERNAMALAGVLPRQLKPSEITGRLGAPWIPPTDVEAFCAEVLDAEVEIEFLATTGRWAVALRAGRRASVSLSSEWGTARADAITLLDASLNQRLHTVTDETADRKRVRNDAETIAARQKQDAISDRFSDWLWEDPGRAARLADRYNQLFCSVAIADHDGSHLTFPGLSATFEPRRHQRDSVARTIVDGRVLLAHAVGAGKTATMVMSAMEMRRLELVAKPAVVVPNHMLEQFTREWLQLYPSAQLLVADKDRLSADRRKEFVARCATGDWDGILFRHSGFARLPLEPATVAAYLGAELERAREALAESSRGKGLSVKRMEKRIAQLEETYQRLLNEERKDDGLYFEETGVDYVFLDEAHLYKNRRVDSSIDGMSHAGSQRAQDLDAKLWTLRRAHGHRVATFATATPVANSMAELWVVQTYLQPDVLAAAGVEPFDGWAATFGRTVTTLELAPDGGSYRLQTRFARFQNVPELMTLYRQVADVKTADELRLPTPALASGVPETVVVASSDVLRAYVADLADRAERVRNRTVDPTEDNMLKITGDGRRAALDLRLVGEAPDRDGKLAAAATRIAAINQRSSSLRYLDDTGQLHPRPGALQLVFCDVSTPAGTGWNAYDELRRLLEARGVPPDTIRYAHDAGTDAEKARLFQACRDGRVAVLIGSTEKMGIGTNVQARAVALHHIDCPWRPADIEQREGRILRQGNQNDSVEVLRYVTEGSFDTYMWQTLERKAAFIAQVSRGDLPSRDVDDVGDQALSFAEVKALATGNPVILEKAGVDNDVARLRRLERAHRDDQHRLQRALESSRARAARAEQRATVLDQAIDARTDVSGDQFRMTVAERTFDKRSDAGDALIAELRALVEDVSTSRPTEVGTLAGMIIAATVERDFGSDVRLQLGDAIEFAVSATELASSDPLGFVRRFERRLTGLDHEAAQARTDVSEARREAERARARLGRPFEHDAELRRLERRQQELNELLAEPVTAAAPVERAGVGMSLA
jgi:N12 class adenine-specific DNA methylase/SAM-dependent methyltransferase